MIVLQSLISHDTIKTNKNLQTRRTARTRAATNENGDENRVVTTTRLTRAKAASLTTTTKQALAPKAANATINAAAANRKRSALGDVSNVHKTDAVAGDKKGLKKPTVKAVGVTKTTVTTEPAVVVTKPTRTRQPLKPQQPAKKETAPAPTRSKKRPAPVIKEDEEEDVVANIENTENIAPAKKHVEEAAPKVEQTEQKAAKRPRIHGPIPAKDYEHEDLDAEDAEDPLMVSEYVEEIFEYLRELEPQTQPNPDYMEDQNDLEWQMRGVLIDWLVEVHTRFRLLPETLFLCVNIVDRFLSTKQVPLEKLQLVGVTAMFIAAKYEEVFSPHVQYFRHVADDGFTEDEILRAERYILATLDYNLSFPNPMNFLRRISKADEYDFQTRTFAKYIMEISLVDHRFMEYLPSHVSAAAMYMSRLILNRGGWVCYTESTTWIVY